MRVCSNPGCPTLIERPGRCPAHAREADRARGSRQQRGYDREHDRLRDLWVPRVSAGRVNCYRCHQPIAPSEPWHLDHTDDRRSYGGPAHARCNLSAAGKAAHR